jgi:hypothetical protein
MLLRAILISSALSAVVGCGAGQVTTETAAAHDPPVDESTYRAVLTTVFDGMLAATDGDADLDATMAAALRIHGVTAAQMARFAVEQPDVVRSANYQNAARVRHANAAQRRSFLAALD